MRMLMLILCVCVVGCRCESKVEFNCSVINWCWVFCFICLSLVNESSCLIDNL